MWLGLGLGLAGRRGVGWTLGADQIGEDEYINLSIVAGLSVEQSDLLKLCRRPTARFYDKCVRKNR